MEKIIDKKIYSTKKAVLVSAYDNGEPKLSSFYEHESLYITAKGCFFILGEGGDESKYASHTMTDYLLNRDIVVMSEEDAYKWLERNNEFEAIKEYFYQEIIEA